MSIRTSLVLAAGVVVGPTTAASQSLTLEQVVTAAPITGSVPAALAWSPDGRTLAFTWDSTGGPSRRVWLVGHDATRRRALPATPAPVRELVWHPAGRMLVALQGDQLVAIDVATGVVRVLVERAPGAGTLTLSPDGTQAAWLADGDLFVAPLPSPASDAPTATGRRVTEVGIPSLSQVGLGTYARRDREIGSATWASAVPAYAWAPDGTTIVAHLVDRRAVRRVPFPYYLGNETQANELRRSYPGDENESRQLVWVDVASGRMSPLPFDRPTDVQVLNAAWSPRGDLLVDRESDDATERWVHVVRPGGAARLVYADRRPSRIYTEAAATWSRDGAQVLLTSDREDRYRVYALTLGDTTLRALTPATSDVQSEPLPLPGGELAWLSTAPNPAERHLWRARAGAAPVQVTRRAGTHRVFVSPDGAMVASLVSDDVTPPHLVLVPMRGGVERAVTPPGGAGLATAGLVTPRYVRFPGAAAGDTLHAKVWLPAAARAGTRVPVIFGPVYSNTVRNRWGGTYGLLQQLLVQRGYAVVQVDVRGSTGYGRAFREAFLFEWGGRDLDDLAATKRWLGGEAWADTARTGIFGSSYGGLISVYALLKRPGLFKAAVAGASAVDPRFFGSDDVAITRRPATHPEAFARGAAQYASGLADRLLLIHGLMDDVVPFKTIADLAEALMREGKDFDLAIAPSATHGWTQRPHHARYLLGKLVQHFERHLPTTP
ncbi:MAG: prolyl oligopeptidase family serine peptidase [Gemmatimonadota bacterium]|jgi:dipeptidyl-peptidase-4